MRKFKIGIVGGGNMATAIYQGILDARLALPEDIIISDVLSSRLEIAKKQGLATTADNSKLDAKYIILATKPQSFGEVAKSLKIDEDTVLISIMAGITIAKVKALTKGTRIVRVMPNTPCMIKKGVSALAFDNVEGKDKEYIFSLFASIGEGIEIKEDKFDAVTSLSGSGPAYVYTFLDALIKGGIEGGLTEHESKMLAIATTQGASEMLRQTDTPISQLISAVCSKGGTTIEAINVLKERRLTDIIVEGMTAARKRSKELSKL